MSYNELIFIYKDIDNLNNNKLIEIVVDIIPDSVSYSYSPNFQSTKTIGRTTPIYTFINGSDETYSFNIKIHEDLLNKDRYKTIQDFVDEIKSLSYPLKRNNILVFPRVYMQLGEIAGFGHINTTISWELPFRDGRYAVANINVMFTIEDDYKATPIEIIKDVIDSKIDGIYYKKIISGKFEEYYRYMYSDNQMQGFFNADTIYEDMFYNKSSTNMVYDSAFVKLEADYKKLEALFSIYKDVDISNALLMNNIKNTIKESEGFNKQSFLEKVKQSTDITEVPGINIKVNTVNHLTTIRTSENIKEFEKFLDSYIKDNIDIRFKGDKDLAEAFKKEEISILLNIYANIFEHWKEAMTFGKGS